MSIVTCLCRILLSFQVCFLRAGPDEGLEWEAKLAPGAETDPVALNIAFGAKDIPNRDTVESLKGAYEIQPHSFAKLAPKTRNDGVYQVSVKRESGHYVPPDMAGTGPFYLIRADTNYYALTERNFARLFAPIETEYEVLPYLEAHQALFGNPFAQIVTTETEEQAVEGRKRPPRLTRIKELKDGFRVKLVSYTIVYIEAYTEKRLHVGRDGIVKVEKPERIIKKLGEGMVF